MNNAMDFELIFSNLYGSKSKYGGSRSETPGSEAQIWRNFVECFQQGIQTYEIFEKYQILGEIETHLKRAIYKIRAHKMKQKFNDKLNKIMAENDPYPFTQEKLKDFNLFIDELYQYSKIYLK